MTGHKMQGTKCHHFHNCDVCGSWFSEIIQRKKEHMEKLYAVNENTIRNEVCETCYRRYTKFVESIGEDGQEEILENYRGVKLMTDLDFKIFVDTVKSSLVSISSALKEINININALNERINALDKVEEDE